MSDTNETNEATLRLALLDAETRDLHRQLSELRVEAQAQRAGRVEAEHRLALLVGDAGRRVLAIRSHKLVRRLRKRVAELEAFEGSMAETAMKGAQEVIALQARVEALMHGSETLEREREEARDGWQRAQNDLVMARAEIANLKAQALVRGQRSRYECVTPAGTLYLDDPDANSVQFREAVRYAFASIASRPDAGPEDKVAAGEAIRKFEDGETSAGKLRDELQLPEAPAPVERKPPFRDWTDEDRAKVVPGATVWYGGDALVEPHRVELTSTVQERRGCATVRTGPFVLALDNCDPATIEPPATQAAPVERPPAPDLRRGDRVKDSAGREWTIGDGSRMVYRRGDWFVSGVSPSSISNMVAASSLDFSTRVRTWQPGEVVPPATYAEPERPPAPWAMVWPDLRAGDLVKDLAGRELKVTGYPAWSEKGRYWFVPVLGATGTQRADNFDLSTRVRTWQPGEVVPQAPLSVARNSSTGARAFTASGGINPNLPLAEPWTQTGI